MIWLSYRLSAKMITFAHGCFGLWQKQSNQKGLTPAIGASPDFSARLKIVLSDSSNKKFVSYRVSNRSH